jgi:multiple sugar transport system substrate-binding protein
MEKRRLSRRDFLRLSATAATSAAIAACAPAAPQVVEVEKPVVVKEEVVKEVPVEKVVEKEVQVMVTATPAGRPVIRWQGSSSADYMELNSQAVAVFNEATPHIDFRVEPIPPGGRMEKMMAAMVAGVSADIIEYWALWFAKLHQRGQLIDMQPFVDATMTQEDIDDFAPNEWDNFERLSFIPGMRLAMPRYINFMWLHYNETYLDESGVDHPDKSWTLEDLREAAEKCVVRDSGGKITRWGSAFDGASGMERQFYNLERFGGAFVEYDQPDKCLMDKPESQEAFEWLRARYFDDETWMTQQMLNSLGGGNSVPTGYTAFQEEGGPYYTWLQDTEGLWDINVTHPPIGPVERTSYLVTDGFGMWSGTKWPDAAWECMQFLSGPVYQEMRMRATCRIAVRMSAMAHYKEAWADKVGGLMENYNLDTVIEALEMGYGRDDERFVCQAEAEEIINPLLEAVFVVGDTPVSVFADACADVDAVQTCDMAETWRAWKGAQ